MSRRKVSSSSCIQPTSFSGFSAGMSAGTRVSWNEVEVGQEDKRQVPVLTGDLKDKWATSSSVLKSHENHLRAHGKDQARLRGLLSLQDGLWYHLENGK